MSNRQVPGVRRWLRFNAVGVAGAFLQLGVLALLTRLGGWPYLPATMFAVELTVLHNLAWHERWTWRDRGARGPTRATRALRFHAVNGGVSLAGNVLLTWLLAGRLGLDPIAANAAAVGACSLLNFFASDRLVFAGPRRGMNSGDSVGPCRGAGRRVAATGALFALSWVSIGAAGGGGPVPPATLAAWQAYERQVDARYARDTSAPFFAADALGGPSSWRQQALAGGIPMFQAWAPAAGASPPDVPDGRIHHWVGATLVRGLTVADVINALEAGAGQESRSYEDVIASRLLSRDGDRVQVFLKLRRTKVITATYNTEHRVEYRRLGPSRGSSRSVATRIAELAEAGTPAEREKTPAEDSGYLWRLNAYWRFEQAADGVLIECESVSLSRGVPTLLRPFISGIVEGVARESLEKTLISVQHTLAAPRQTAGGR